MKTGGSLGGKNSGGRTSGARSSRALSTIFYKLRHLDREIANLDKQIEIAGLWMRQAKFLALKTKRKEMDLARKQVREQRKLYK